MPELHDTLMLFYYNPNQCVCNLKLQAIRTLKLKKTFSQRNMRIGEKN